MTHLRNRSSLAAVPKAAARRGSAAVLITAMMFVFIVTAAITVDYAYMQLVRTELRTAADAAAKAGAEALSRTQSPGQAKHAAVDYAAANSVGGQPFRLSQSDVTIGRVSASSGGRWAFDPAGTPPNAVRVNARTGEDAAQGAIPLFFGNIVGHNNFTPSYQATAGQQDVEVCLCLDRSGSMCFDMSGEDYSYAPKNPLLSKFKQWGTEWQNALSPPHPTASRWAALAGAVNVFLNEASNYDPEPRTALVTWASDYTMPVKPYTVFKPATTDVPLPSSSSFLWSSDVLAIQNSVSTLGQNPMMGGTNLSAGLDMGVSVLTGTNSNTFASKIIILMTDGEWNEGRDPLQAAYDARSQGIIVHCVSVLTQKQSVLQEIASITGGRYFSTQNETELRNAFSELARSLPVVLTE